MAVLADRAYYELLWVAEVSVYLKKKKIPRKHLLLKEWAYISSEIWDFIRVVAENREAGKMF